MLARELWWPAQGDPVCEAGAWLLVDPGDLERALQTSVIAALGCGGQERSCSSYSRTQELAWQWLEGEGQDVSQRQQEFIHLVLSSECLKWKRGRAVPPAAAAWLMELCPPACPCAGVTCARPVPLGSEVGLAGEEPPEQVVIPAEKEEITPEGEEGLYGDSSAFFVV